MVREAGDVVGEKDPRVLTQEAALVGNQSKGGLLVILISKLLVFFPQKTGGTE